MDKKRILEILEGAKDDNGEIPMSLVRKAFEKIEEPCTDAVSRQAAIDAILAVTGNSSVRELYEHVQEHGLSEMWSGGVNAAIDTIIAVPSAQPEIIHCKDCKHYKAYDYTGKLACHYVIGGTVEKKPDDFCSRAERLTNGTNQ